MENVAFNYWLVSPVEDVEFILRLILNTKDNDFCSPEILDFHMLPNMNSKNMYSFLFLNVQSGQLENAFEFQKNFLSSYRLSRADTFSTYHK